MSNILTGWLLGWFVLAAILWITGTNPSALANKHCAHISDRTKFEECRKEFLK